MRFVSVFTAPAVGAASTAGPLLRARGDHVLVSRLDPRARWRVRRLECLWISSRANASLETDRAGSGRAELELPLASVCAEFAAQIAEQHIKALEGQ